VDLALLHLEIFKDISIYDGIEIFRDVLMACVILHNMIVEDEGAHNIGAVDFEYKQLNEAQVN
jgi:hypothetical protein